LWIAFFCRFFGEFFANLGVEFFKVFCYYNCYRNITLDFFQVFFVEYMQKVIVFWRLNIVFAKPVLIHQNTGFLCDTGSFVGGKKK